MKVPFTNRFIRKSIFKIGIPVLFLMAVGLFFAFQNPNYDTNSKMKSLFIYNFSKYIDWPQDYKSGEFVIAVMGDDPIISHLKNSLINKKVFNLNIDVHVLKSMDEIDKAHIFYLPKSASGDFGSLLNKFKSTPTLIVTEDDGLGAKGSAINFVVVQNRIKFEINKKSIADHNLTLSTQLEKLAVEIYN